LSWEYKTFHYQPIVGFVRSRINSQNLEERLNSLSKLGWEYVEIIDCTIGLFQRKDYIVLLRRKKSEPNKKIESNV